MHVFLVLHNTIILFHAFRFTVFGLCVPSYLERNIHGDLPRDFTFGMKVHQRVPSCQM
jgi:hypothetical protein